MEVSSSQPARSVPVHVQPARLRPWLPIAAPRVALRALCTSASKSAGTPISKNWGHILGLYINTKQTIKAMSTH